MTLTGAVAVDLLFVMPRPKTGRRVLPAVRPDIDKLTRLVLDALTDAGVIVDDGQVTDLTVRKRYPDADQPWTLPEPGVRVKVEPAPDPYGDQLAML